MANTRIVLNKQSDLILTEAQIVAPVGIVEADIAGLVAHFQAVEQSIAQEVARATNEDAKHDNEIEAEESSRIAGDSSLESKVNADVSIEKAGRESADASLEQELGEYIDESIKTEVGERSAADASLDAKVSTEKDRIDAILLASDADKDSFAEIVTLINSVDTENDQAFASYVLSNNAAVSTEKAGRESADASLDVKIDSLPSVDNNTMEVDSNNQIKLKDVVAPADGGEPRKFVGSTTFGSANNTASGTHSTASGYYGTASGSYSTASGYYATASGNYGSHAEGSNTTASGDYGSHAEGNMTTASGQAAHAEGDTTVASGQAAHAEGFQTNASGNFAHAEGISTIASGEGQHVEGKYNEEKVDALSIIGNGDSNERSNILEVYSDKLLASDNVKLTAQPETLTSFDDLTLVTKGWVDGEVSSEESLRIAADASLEAARIAGDASEEAARIAADSVEASSRIAADASLESALDAEISRATEAEGSIATVLSSEVSSIIANTDLSSIDSFAEVVSELDAEESNRLASDISIEAEIDALPLTDDETIEVDGGNNIRLKDVVAEGTAGERTFEGLNKAGAQPSSLAGYDDLSFITKGILDALDSDVSTDISSEESSRIAADASLEAARIAADASLEAARIAGDASEEAARIAADSVEASSRIAGDASLETKVNADVSIEKAAREAADSSLESKVNADVSIEKAAREAADSSLESKVNADVSIEKAGRESADASLEAKVSTEKGRIDAILSAATADSDSFAEIVTLINSVDTENDQAFAAYVLSNDAALSQEVADRESEVSIEKAGRESADASLESKLNSDVSIEKAGRESADLSLESKVNSDISTEKAGRESADASIEVKVNADVSTEKAGREAADASLEAKVSTEKAERESADASLESKIDSDVSTEVAAREAAITAEESTRLSVDEAIKAGVNAALVEIKDMIMYTIEQGTFRAQLQADGDGVTTTFGTAINGSGAIYLNGLLQVQDVDYTLNSFLDAKGNPNTEFIFGVAPESGSSVTIYGQAGFVTDSGWFGDLTPLA